MSHHELPNPRLLIPSADMSEEFKHYSDSIEFFEEYRDVLTRINPGKWVGVSGSRIVGVADTSGALVDIIRSKGEEPRITRIEHLGTANTSQLPG